MDNNWMTSLEHNDDIEMELVALTENWNGGSVKVWWTERKADCPTQ